LPEEFDAKAATFVCGFLAWRQEGTLCKAD
jgi:hypothetical protein